MKPSTYIPDATLQSALEEFPVELHLTNAPGCARRVGTVNGVVWVMTSHGHEEFIGSPPESFLAKLRDKRYHECPTSGLCSLPAKSLAEEAAEREEAKKMELKRQAEAIAQAGVTDLRVSRGGSAVSPSWYVHATIKGRHERTSLDAIKDAASQPDNGDDLVPLYRGILAVAERLIAREHSCQS